MIRSMFTGVSGLRNHQAMMDVIGNNVANVNTIGFKSSMVTFSDILSQTIAGASAPQAGAGGINAQQIGLGMKVASVTDLHTQGALMSTGRVTDLAIQGDGFFVVNDGTRNLYTRAGNFTLDADGNLVSSATGYIVQGWLADTSGSIDTNTTVTDISIPAATTTMAPQATSSTNWAGNLDASESVGGSVVTTITIYDSQGGTHQLMVTFTKVADNSWTWASEVDGVPDETGTVDFNPDGTFLSNTPDTDGTIDFVPAGADPISITPDFSGMMQYAASNTAQASDQDGYASGTLKAIAISNRGEISGVFSNGLSRLLGQVALANFNNASGLLKESDSMYVISANSGEPLIGTAGSGGRGIVSAGALEMSNVDLAKEFTNMIVTQRGFQANARVISASDDMLQELVNLKR